MTKKDITFSKKGKEPDTKNIRLLAIRQEGYSRVLSVTKILPNEWQYVHIEIVKTSKDYVTVKFSKAM